MNIKVKTSDGQDLGELIRFLKTIQRCCEIGASRESHLSVDGYGSARMFFEFEMESHINKKELREKVEEMRISFWVSNDRRIKQISESIGVDGYNKALDDVLNLLK